MVLKKYGGKYKKKYDMMQNILSSFFINYNFNLLLFFLSFFVFYFLINIFNFSNNIYIKFFQYFFLSLIFNIFFFLIIDYILNNNIIYASPIDDDDKNLNIGISGSVSLDKEGVKAIAQSIESVGNNVSRNIGLPAFVASVTGATAKVLKSSSLPGSQKAAIIGLSAMGSTATYLGANYASKLIEKSSSSSSSSSTPPSSSIPPLSSIPPSSSTPPSDSFAPSPFEEDLISKLFNNENLVEGLIYSITFINIANVILLLNLLLIFVYKYILNKNLEFKFIDKLFPISYSVKIKSFIKRYLQYSGKLSNYYIIFIIIIVLIFSISSTYFLLFIIENLEYLCKLYLSYS